MTKLFSKMDTFKTNKLKVYRQLEDDLAAGDRKASAFFKFGAAEINAARVFNGLPALQRDSEGRYTPTPVGEGKSVE